MHARSTTTSDCPCPCPTAVKPVAFPADDQKILEYWRKIDAFQTGQKLSRERLEKGQGKGEYRFYDGPPFATGLPHYGHLLLGTIKVRPPLQKCSV